MNRLAFRSQVERALKEKVRKTNTRTARKARRNLRKMVRNLHRIGDLDSHRLASKWSRIARGLRR